MEMMSNDTAVLRIVKTSSLWQIFLILGLGISSSFLLAYDFILGITFVFLVLLFLFYFAFGIGKTLLVLLFIRVNLDAFHGQFNMSFASVKTISLPALIGIFMLVLGVLQILPRKSSLRNLPIIKAWSFFLVACLLSLPFSQNLANSLSEFLELCSFVVLFVLVVISIRSKRDVQNMVVCLILSSVIPIIVGLIQILNNRYIVVGLEPSFRVYSTLPHPSAYAFYLIIIAVLTISLMNRGKNPPHKVKSIILLAFISVSLVYTFTRGAWLGLALSLFVLGILQKKKFQLFSPVIVALLFLNVPLIYERFQPIFDPRLSKFTSFAWRFGLWNSAISYFLAHPLFGIGFGNFILIGHEITNFFMNAHNDYLKLLVETGIVGFLGFIWVLASTWRIGIAAFKRVTDPYLKSIAAGFIAVLLSYLCMSFSDNIFNHGAFQWYLWAYAGLITAMYRMDFSKN